LQLSEIDGRFALSGQRNPATTSPLITNVSGRCIRWVGDCSII
jgi:hypothetical protein